MIDHAGIGVSDQGHDKHTIRTGTIYDLVCLKA